MGEKTDSKDTSDAFEDPLVSELWLDITDFTDDPTVAKAIVQHCTLKLWNMPWATWHKLAEQSAASISNQRAADT